MRSRTWTSLPRRYSILRRPANRQTAPLLHPLGRHRASALGERQGRGAPVPADRELDRGVDDLEEELRLRRGEGFGGTLPRRLHEEVRSFACDREPEPGLELVDPEQPVELLGGE